MQFFKVRTIQIGGGSNPQEPGNLWPDILERFVTGIESERHDIMSWPKLSFCGPDGEFAMTRFEPEIGGFFAIGRGGSEGASPEGCFDSEGLGTARVLQTLRTLLGGKYPGAALSFGDQARLVIVNRGQLLEIGHENLPKSYDLYGSWVSSLTRRVQPAAARA